MFVGRGKWSRVEGGVRFRSRPLCLLGGDRNTGRDLPSVCLNFEKPCKPSELLKAGRAAGLTRPDPSERTALAARSAMAGAGGRRPM